MITDTLLRNLQLPGIGRALLVRLFKGELTQEQFQFECAYWMTGDLSTMVYTPAPAIPQDVLDYLEKKQYDPKYELSRKFWEQPHIVCYLNQHKEMRAKNNTHKYWLLFLKKHIPSGDIVNHKRIQQVMDTYSAEAIK